ncbi:MAG: MBL fold metallo-hydrolase [Candidatus Latescibacterota bacterium]
MEITFWGARGSIPDPLNAEQVMERVTGAVAGADGVDCSDREAVRAYVATLPFCRRATFGGNTACVEVRSGEDFLILDAGSGIRLLGKKLMAGAFGRGEGTAHVLLSHTHWDHIMGFPFFAPAFVPGNQIVFYGCHDDLEGRLRYQQSRGHFPVEMDSMSADFRFVTLDTREEIRIGPFSLRTLKQFHPGASYGYRVEAESEAVVYATDSEYESLDSNYLSKYLTFFQNADVLIFDALVGPNESIQKQRWGHSSALCGVDIARQAGAKKLVLFHHDPERDDEAIQRIADEAIEYARRTGSDSALEIVPAYDGLKMAV